jgi:hypothetical protein
MPITPKFSSQTSTPTNIHVNQHGMEAIFGATFLTGQGVLPKGQVIGKITASGKYGKFKNTTVAENALEAATTVTLTDASGFQVGDSIVIGTEAAKVISNINGNVVTVTALAANQNAGVAAKANNGLEKAVGILADDVDTTQGDALGQYYVHGFFIASAIKNLNAAARTDLPLAAFL